MNINLKFLNDLPQMLGALLTILSLIATIAGLAGGGGSSSLAGKPATPEAVAEALNDYRADYNLPPVEHREDIDAIAQNWAEYMAKTGKYHHNPRYDTILSDGTYVASENILLTTSGESAEDIIRSWHNSPGHRLNMQDPRWDSVGIGIATGRGGKLYAVQNFGVENILELALN